MSPSRESLARCAPGGCEYPGAHRPIGALT